MSYATTTDYSDDWSTEEATALETFDTPELEITLTVDGPDHWDMSDADIKAFCVDE